MPATGWRKVDSFTQVEKALLRPIAETLAMLDGNAFLSQNHYTWYEQYLPEADAIFQANRGVTGWAGLSSIVRMREHETESIREAYESWMMLKTLAQGV